MPAVRVRRHKEEDIVFQHMFYELRKRIFRRILGQLRTKILSRRLGKL